MTKRKFEKNPLFTLDDLKNALTKKKEQIEKLKEEEKARRKERIFKKLEDKFEEDAEIEKHQQRKKGSKKHKNHR